jgi:dynein heavy chain
LNIKIVPILTGCELTSYDKDSIKEFPPSGAYIYGLFMEGGRFDRKKMCIEECLPRRLLDPVPAVWLKPVITAEYNPVSVYDCPLYKTSIRAGTLSTTGHSTNFVVSLPVPYQGEKGQEHWIRRGCAMLCMPDE